MEAIQEDQIMGWSETAGKNLTATGQDQDRHRYETAQQQLFQFRPAQVAQLRCQLLRLQVLRTRSRTMI